MHAAKLPRPLRAPLSVVEQQHQQQRRYLYVDLKWRRKVERAVWQTTGGQGPRAKGTSGRIRQCHLGSSAPCGQDAPTFHSAAGRSSQSPKPEKLPTPKRLQKSNQPSLATRVVVGPRFRRFHLGLWFFFFFLVSSYRILFQLYFDLIFSNRTLFSSIVNSLLTKFRAVLSVNEESPKSNW